MSRAAWRSAVLFVLLFWGVVLAVFAAGTCTTWHIVSGSYSIDGDLGPQSGFCAAAQSFAATTWGETYFANCVATSEYEGSFRAGYSADPGQFFDYTATRNGCTPDPVEGGVSSPELTDAESGNLVAWGFLVLLVGIGYIGGRLR